MPTEYKIKDGVVVSRTSGKFTFDEAKDFRTKLAADPAYNPESPHLIDFSEVEDVDLTFEEIRQLAFADPFGNRARRAIVAPGNHAYGIARMYEALVRAGGSPLEVFRDIKAARKWLGLQQTEDE